MSPSTITELGAYGIILLSFIMGSAWLFRINLPQQRADFLNALTKIAEQFEQSRLKEAELHKLVQAQQKEAHDKEITLLANKLTDNTIEIQKFNTQFQHFLAIFVATRGENAETVVNFYRQLNGKQ